MVKKWNIRSKILLVILSCLAINGCAGLAQDIKEGNFLANSPLAQSLTTKPNWVEEAQFYDDNFTDYSKDYRADLIIKELKDNNVSYSVEDRIFRFKRKYIFIDGKQIWPTKNDELSIQERVSGNSKKQKEKQNYYKNKPELN